MTFPPAFRYQALPMRVRFGAGSVALLAEELDHLGLGAVLVVSSPGRRAADTAGAIADRLGHRCAGRHPRARTHVPVEVAREGRAEAERLGADGVLAVGGGSAIGLAKAVALTTGLPVVAVPTTYAGSEMTSVWGVTDAGVKQTGRDPKVLPVSVIYDPELTVGLPVPESVTSAMNAVAHAVEALYAPDISPVIALMAEEGLAAMVDALPRIRSAATDLGARAQAQYGAWLCGACLGATTMSLHHRLCHALGGALDLPHGPTHTVVLPHAMAYNLPAVPEVSARLSHLLGGVEPALGLWELAGRLGAPRSLRDLGMQEQDIGVVADQVVATPYANPRPVTREAVAALLRRAWAGTPPGQASGAAL